ncbi:hypothetical protein ARSEF1564_010013 [Beauveria bassiana]
MTQAPVMQQQQQQQQPVRPTFPVFALSDKSDVKMVRDSRGLMPILAKSFPLEFFTKTSKGPFSAKAPPPWLKDALTGI